MPRNHIHHRKPRPPEPIPQPAATTGARPTAPPSSAPKPDPKPASAQSKCTPRGTTSVAADIAGLRARLVGLPAGTSAPHPPPSSTGETRLPRTRKPKPPFMAFLATLHETRDLVRAVYPRLARDVQTQVGASLNATLGEIVPLLNGAAERNGYGVQLELGDFAFVFLGDQQLGNEQVGRSAVRRGVCF